MNKRTFLLFLVAALVLTLLPRSTSSASAEEAILSGTCGESLVWSYDPETAVLTITGSGRMNSYMQEPAPWSSYTGEIREISLPEGLTNIGDQAFLNCTALTTVELPASVACIGDSAFKNCCVMQAIDLPEGLTELGIFAFAECTALREIVLPEGIELVSWYCFYDCAGLEAVTLPDSMTELEECAFAGCKSLSAIKLPAGLQSIGKSAFDGCRSLTGIVFPNNLKEIRENAFRRCTSLRTVELPQSVTFLGRNAFYKCEQLKQVVVRNPGCMVHTGYPSTGDDTGEDLDMETVMDARSAYGSMADELMGDETGEDLNAVQESFGPNETVIVYGRHDEDYQNSPELVYEIYKFRYPESYAQTYQYTFYATNVFSDVKQGKYYEIPVAWAYGKGVTNGKDETHFGPGDTCTRGQVVRFLWNAMGQPEPNITENPFVDAVPGKYYYDAMLWAVENGITNGKDETHFAPNDTCTRGQVVRFLWNAMGQPEPTLTENPFVDAVPGKYYYDAMLWALENGVTKGIDETHFAPNQTCTRGQVVTFLYNTLS